MKQFQVKRNTQIFDFLKCKGIAVSSLLSILLILPFYSIANVYQLMRCGTNKLEIEGKKSTFYDTKNNEFIDWRKLLMLHVKRFNYLIKNNINLKSDKIKAIIFDDTKIEKTGKKIEKVSMVHDHVTQRFILGFKLLVCGFWDGESFIPLDFTLHREKGTKQKDIINEHNRCKKQLDKKQNELEIVDKKISELNKNVKEKEQKYLDKPNKINKLNYDKITLKQLKSVQQKNDLTVEIENIREAKKEAYKKLKRYYSSDYLYGLTTKERQEQFKKAVSTKSHGFKRRKEADKSKIDCMLEMLSRVLKSGIEPDYVLVDSCFFASNYWKN